MELLVIKLRLSTSELYSTVPFRGMTAAYPRWPGWQLSSHLELEVCRAAFVLSSRGSYR